MYESHSTEEHSSTDESDSSSDDFPMPDTPKHRKSRDDYDTLKNRIKELNKKIYQKDIKKKNKH